MAEKTLLDAISAAVDSPDGTPPVVETPPAGETNADADDSSVSDEPGPDGESADGETDGDGTKPDGEADKGADAGAVPDVAKGAEGDKGGTKAPEGAKAPELGPDGKPKQPEPAKKADPVNDPMDSRWKKQTTERVQSLIDMVKTKDQQLEQADTLFGAIESTGMSPDQLSHMLGYAHARHKGTPEQKKQAYDFLKAELRAVALELGATDSVDFLADHTDLQEAVAANTITAEYAKEVALARSRTARDTQNATAATAQTAAQQAYTSGVNALGAVGSALAKRDGVAAFTAKKDVLVAALKPVFAELAPAKWAQAFQQAYDAMPKPAAAVVPPVVPPKVPGQQPLRPGTPAGGGGKKEPKNMQEAVFAAFDTQE